MKKGSNQPGGLPQPSYAVQKTKLGPVTVSLPTWHILDVDEAVSLLDVDAATGLQLQQAQTRAATHGPNRLAGKPPRSPWLLFFGQFKNFLIVVLILAAALAAGIGKITDAAVILTVLLLNAALGFYHEYRPEQSRAWPRSRKCSR